MLTRCRLQSVSDRTLEVIRLGGMLEDASIKLPAVASSLTTASTRGMLGALIASERRAPGAGAGGRSPLPRSPPRRPAAPERLAAAGFVAAHGLIEGHQPLPGGARHAAAPARRTWSLPTCRLDIVGRLSDTPERATVPRRSTRTLVKRPPAEDHESMTVRRTIENTGVQGDGRVEVVTGPGSPAREPQGQVPNR